MNWAVVPRNGEDIGEVGYAIDILCRCSETATLS